MKNEYCKRFAAVVEVGIHSTTIVRLSQLVAVDRACLTAVRKLIENNA